MSNTVILGASPKKHRYSHLAHKTLQEKGYNVIPIHPVHQEILGDEVINHIKDVWQPIDTLTVYVSSARFAPIIDDIIRLTPKRVIFNPGAECPELYHEFPEHIKIVEGCTIVMVNTGQY